MHKKHLMVADGLTDAVDELYERFGGWRIVWSLALSGLRRRRRRNRLSGLSNRMRRDIGIEEVDERLRLAFFHWWNIRP